VVGGGYIGLEMATALRARGLAVTLIHDSLQLLGREEDWLTKKLVERLERCRVTVRLNTTADVGGELPYDLVLLAAGLKPNVEAMAEAGAELGRTGALRVDDRQESSLSGVYAAGDCCEAMHVVSGKPVWVPLGTTANKTGRVAGSNAAGGRERFAGIAGTSIVRVAGMAVAMTGLSVQQARRDGFSPVEALIESREKPKYFHGRKTSVQLVADRNSRRLLGGVVLGEQTAAGRVNVIAAALTARMKADELAGLDLAYAPPYASVSDPLLVAAQQLLKALD
jgi:NADPH-dependent 2,4-dienoyl-CoA reductase/sulfur reductase-like enzyme